MKALAYTLDIASPLWRGVAGVEEAVARAAAALPDLDFAAEAAIRLTGDGEIAALNGRYRGKPKPTNVLSFPAPKNFPVPLGTPRPLGDVVLAFETVAREADEQEKSIEDHMTHLVVHGLLHLLGHDHESDEEALDMEDRERGILAALGIADPYDGSAAS